MTAGSQESQREIIDLPRAEAGRSLVIDFSKGSITGISDLNGMCLAQAHASIS
jgi:hypothetical protein